MSALQLSDFEGAVGETWDVDLGAGTAVGLRLDKAQPLARALREEGGFRLEWTGPSDTFLPQATYRFRRGAAQFEMFIVPVAKDGADYRYEAIFN
ncbi:MAG TPA: hypothetical protein VKI45_05600 [Allosphingosinicella sp.]|nr:hypothetical protein [Allosphingosinicella sp.]